MALTKIDCHLFRGADAQLETSSYVVVNPHWQPGRVVFVGACAVRQGVGSQVAYKLSIQHFLEGVLSYFASLNGGGEPRSEEKSLKVLEEAFRSANTAVHEFGLKLAAGGRMASSLLGLVIENKVIAAARAGEGAAYLFRDGSLFPFFGDKDELNKVTKDPALGSFVGAQLQIAVELVSVPIEPGDKIFVFSRPLHVRSQGLLCNAASELRTEATELQDFNEVQLACEELFERVCADSEDLEFAMAANVGPEALYLWKRVPTGLIE